MGRARGSASLLSSQGRGIGAHDGLKKDPRCLSRVAAGNPGSLDLCRWPQGASQGASEKSGMLWIWESEGQAGASHSLGHRTLSSTRAWKHGAPQNPPDATWLEGQLWVSLPSPLPGA